MDLGLEGDVRGGKLERWFQERQKWKALDDGSLART